jgi:hypothetical protein
VSDEEVWHCPGPACTMGILVSGDDWAAVHAHRLWHERMQPSPADPETVADVPVPCGNPRPGQAETDPKWRDEQTGAFLPSVCHRFPHDQDRGDPQLARCTGCGGILGVPSKRETFEIDHSFSPRSQLANPELQRTPVEAPSYVATSADLTAQHARVAGIPDPGVTPAPARSTMPPYEAPAAPTGDEALVYGMYW